MAAQRVGDAEGSSHHRSPLVDGNLPWILAIVLAILGALSMAEWKRIDAEAREALMAARRNELAITELRPALVQIQYSLKEIQETLKEKRARSGGPR